MTTGLITGAAGFIGSNLADALLDRGYDVRGVDNFETGRESNLETIRSTDSFSFYETDIRDEEAMDQLMEGVDYVFHQAAVPSVPRSVEDPVATTDANCTGTAVVLDSAKENDVERVVVASSSSLYGSSEQLPKQEDMQVRPESPYALSKYYTEKLALQFDELYDVDAVALRYFNVFGPNQYPNGQYAAVIPKFIKFILAGERPVVYGDGRQSRDFTFIDNVVEANALAAESDVGGEQFNVGCGDNTTINQLVEMLNEIIDTDIEPTYGEPRPGDVRHSHADISKAKSVLGYSPTVDVTEGLRRTVASLRSN